MNQAQYNRAISEFTLAIELKPGYAAAYRNRGFAYIKLKTNQRGTDTDLEKALPDLIRAQRLTPENSIVYRNLACYYAEIYKVDQTNEDLQKAIENLQEAKKFGFRENKWIEYEECFEIILEQTRFREVLDEL